MNELVLYEASFRIVKTLRVMRCGQNISIIMHEMKKREGSEKKRALWRYSMIHPQDPEDILGRHSVRKG